MPGQVESYPVYLISGELPGCGSTTLANLLGERILELEGIKPEVICVGQRIREVLGVTTERDMEEVLINVPDPSTYDPTIYEGLPTDRPVIVEGKLATKVGAGYIENRPVHLIDLTVHPFQSAVRIMQREGIRYETVLVESKTDSLMEYYRRVLARASHVSDLRTAELQPAAQTTYNESTTTRRIFDTGLLSSGEIVRQILDVAEDSGEIQKESIGLLTDFASWLSSFSIKLNGFHLNPQDSVHFNYNLGNLLFQIKRLYVNNNHSSTESLRVDVKENIIDSVFSLFMKSVPRFYQSKDTTDIVVDDKSTKWTPEFYKIAMALPTLKTLLKDKVILDPFGGAGSLMFYLAAKQIPDSVIVSDICYPGGESIENGDDALTYAPTLNQQSIMKLFSELPSWCRPNFSRIKGFATADAMKLPFIDNAVDFVVGDPPYGINCTQGSEQVLAFALPELLRVSKEGVLTMIPEFWLDVLQKSPHKITKLSEDLSMGSSNLPTCYVLIQNPE